MKNEARPGFKSTKAVYQEYVSGMSRKRIGQEFNSDTERLRQLYEEAISDDEHNLSGRDLPGHQKFLRLFSELTQRLNPTRRLLFGLSLVTFVLHYLFAIFGVSNFIFFYELLFPFAFASILMLLLIELLEKTDVKEELELARDIQLSLLPSTHFESDEYEICSFANTAKDVGGDYVDLIETDEGLYKIIADVSGKGLSAALYMVRMQALVHLIIENRKPSPKELFLALNDFVKSDVKDQTFVTACAVFFPKGKDEMLFARAGHNPPILFSKEHDATFKLLSDGYALGMTSSKNLESHLQEKKFHFKSGDSLLLYTDGLVEARNAFGEEYGVQRIESILNVYGSLHAKTVIKKIETSLDSFVGDVKPFDDITFTSVHRK